MGETETGIDRYQEAQEAQGGQEADPIQEGVESKSILQNIVHIINIETEMIRGPQNERDPTREAVGLLLEANSTNLKAEKIDQDQSPQNAVEGLSQRIRDGQGNRDPEPQEVEMTPVKVPDVGPAKDRFLVSPSKTNLTTRRHNQIRIMATFLKMKSTVRKQMRLR